MEEKKVFNLESTPIYSGNIYAEHDTINLEVENAKKEVSEIMDEFKNKDLINNKDIHYELKLLTEKTDRRFENLENNINHRFDNIQKDMDSKFDNIQKDMDNKFDNIQKDMDSKFDNIQKDMDSKFNIIQKDINNIPLIISNSININNDKLRIEQKENMHWTIGTIIAVLGLIITIATLILK